ncbi:hypothetical protein FJ251_00340 [bacterium]|nr:hypothetical protein [bacterium]
MPLRNCLSLSLRLGLGTLLLGSLTIRAGAAWQGSVGSEAGVELVRNPAAPAAGEITLEPMLLWHLGAEEDADDSEVFGRVTEIVVDDAGVSYLLDSQLHEIRVFSPTGEYLRSLGRNGEGPGEFVNGLHLFLLPENRLGVAQMMPSRIAVLGTGGEGFSDLHVPGVEGAAFSMIDGARAAAGHCVLSLMTPIAGPERSETRKRLIAVDPAGKLLATYSQLSEFHEGGGIVLRFGSGESEDEDFMAQWDVDAAGRVYTAPFYDQYLIRVYAADGTLSRLIRRDGERIKRSREEIAEIEERQAGIPESVPRPTISPYLRQIQSFLTRPDGSLWVSTAAGSRERRAGRVGPFDRFDAEGRFQQRLWLAADYDPERDEIIVTGDRLFVLKEAQMVSSSFSASSGNMSMQIRMGARSEDEDEARGEAAPFSVISYRLPAGY